MPAKKATKTKAKTTAKKSVKKAPAKKTVKKKPVAKKTKQNKVVAKIANNKSKIAPYFIISPKPEITSSLGNVFRRF